MAQSVSGAENPLGKKAENYEALAHFACALITTRFLG
jgi:hypothetical protein